MNQHPRALDDIALAGPDQDDPETRTAATGRFDCPQLHAMPPDRRQLLTETEIDGGYYRAQDPRFQLAELRALNNTLARMVEVVERMETRAAETQLALAAVAEKLGGGDRDRQPRSDR